MSPLERRTPLQPGQGLRRTPMRRTGRKPVARRRDTGPSSAVRDIVAARCGGRCEICDRPLAGTPWSRHHRNPRQMGGKRRAGINEASNLLAICGTGTTGCHGRVEANRRVAYTAGWLVHDRDDPRLVPVELARGLTWLDDDGMYLTTPPSTTETGAP
ncbi:HNH endonuclease [Nocardioides alkalitolerans]|uniref:HNH endonuclease n=1 Tax=Nocardioides alkalitolerans TaxID=281714 RepID=UPI000425317F|nr:HNH endonuclease signature motif containing protein [Nocardioides alkalitolerans]